MFWSVPDWQTSMRSVTETLVPELRRQGVRVRTPGDREDRLTVNMWLSIFRAPEHPTRSWASHLKWLEMDGLDGWLDAAGPHVWLLALSRAAEKAALDAGHARTVYAPHAYPAEFQPMDRGEARRLLDLGIGEDEFIALAVGDPRDPRKRMQQSAAALRRWCEESGRGGRLLVPNGATREALTVHYAAADVTLFPSQYEAFGLPVIESQACGTPVIATAYGSMAELVRHGATVQGERRAAVRDFSVIDTNGDERPHVRLTMYERDVSADEIARAIDVVASTEYDPRVVSAAVEEYAVERIVRERWLPFLREVGEPVK